MLWKLKKIESKDLPLEEAKYIPGYIDRESGMQKAAFVKIENDNIIFESVKGKRFIVKPNGISLLMTENKEYKKLLI